MAGTKQSVSVEEQRKRNREYQRKEKVSSDPDSRRWNSVCFTTVWILRTHSPDIYK